MPTHKPYTFAIRSSHHTNPKLQKSMSCQRYEQNVNKNTKTQQSIKIIAEIVVNMNIVARKNISSKMKNPASEIGYYSYTNR